jgi:hypothetical protein
VPSRLQALARICTNASPSAAEVIDACSVIGDALAAEDAYVIGQAIGVVAGRPAIAAYGSSRGYWLVWRRLVATLRSVVCSMPRTASWPAASARASRGDARRSHPSGDESNSDL